MANVKKNGAGAASQKKTVRAAGAGYCVYLGPSIRGSVQYGAVIPGSKADICSQYAEAIGKFPLVAALIVPGERLAEARVQIKTPGNALYYQLRRLAAQVAAGK